MIKNIWSTIEVYCRYRHLVPVLMEIQEGGQSLFYACPKYHFENRAANEPGCPNRISLIDYEIMIEHISSEIERADLNNEVVDLTNHKWKTSKGIEFEVFEHGEKIKVYMLNKKAVR